MVRPATRCSFALALIASLLSSSGRAQVVAVPSATDPVRPEFSEFLTRLKEQALAQGVSAATVESALTNLEPLEVVVERDRTQAEVVLTIDQYVQRRLTRSFVRTAAEQSRVHRKTLATIGDKYRVSPRLIVAIWGMESNFGRFTGTRPIIQALATLAWDGRRGAFFTSELMDALRILEHGYIELDQMKGSWAGAMGQTQFMPSSYLAHAQDWDGDGRRDIWTTLPDVFASIANYMQAYGWKSGETWGREVKLPKGGPLPLIQKVGVRESGCRASREMTVPLPLAKWQALGVRTAAGRALPKVDRDASLLNAGSKTYLVYRNYDALLGYNCAHAYALAVALLSDRIPNK
jgi:membrane-bound lytic murein transglycosylase B